MDFERLVDRHKDAVYRQMIRVCGNHDDTEDALAEAILAAYRSSDKLRSEEAFRSWLAIIGKRICIRMRRRDLGPVLDLAEVEVAAPGSMEDEVARDMLKSCVTCAVDSLPEIYREVYVRREIEERSAEEVAEALDLSIPAVKSRLHRARKLVREFLDDALCAAG